MSAPDGGPAFPFEFRSPNTGQEVYPGMTLRDYFAAQALNGYLAGRNSTHVSSRCNDVADACYAYADAMLAAREKEAA